MCEAQGIYQEEAGLGTKRDQSRVGDRQVSSSGNSEPQWRAVGALRQEKSGRASWRKCYPAPQSNVGGSFREPSVKRYEAHGPTYPVRELWSLCPMDTRPAPRVLRKD